MKKTTVTLMLLALLLILPSTMLAQGKKVTLKLNDVALPTALRQVEQQSGYYKINYPYDDMHRYKVSANVNNATAPDAVKTLLKNLPFTATVDGRFILITRIGKPASSVQRKTIRGQVLDAFGEPLIGVTVKIDGTDRGTVTDIDGNYVLDDVDEDQMLTYSYVGKRSLQRKAGAKRAVIILEDNNAILEDVVVTGYQTISKERATGSFSKFTAEDLKNKRYDNISQLLEGEIAGFNTQSQLIRGTSTLNGITQPLYVIDGFPVESSSYDEYGQLTDNIPNINVNDIESVTVLKDAAAASIYGARAANGVVVIVTKKAREKRTTVSFNASLTFHPYSFKKDRLTDAADIIDLEREWAATNPNLQAANAATYAQSLLDNNVYQSQGIRTIANYYAGNISQSEMENTLNSLAQRGYRYYDDVEKYTKRDALYQQYNLSIGRASDGNNFMATLGYRNNKMNDKYTNDNSWTVNIRDILDVTPWLKLEVGSYTYYKKGKEQTFDPLKTEYTYMPYDGLKNDDGTNYTSLGTERYRSTKVKTLLNYGLYSLDITPLDEIGMNLRNNREFTNRTYGKLHFQLPLGFRYNVMFQHEYANNKTDLLYEKESFYVRNLVDQYATEDEWGEGVVYNVPYGDILFNANQISKGYTFRHQLDFEHTFAEKHNVVALIGHEVRKNTVDYKNSTLYNYDSDMLTFEMVDQKVLSDTYGLMGGYGLYADSYAYHRYLDNRYISLFANAAYSYDDKYMLTGSIRWDRSNLWGTSSKYQKKPIWSVGAAWNIDKEKWFDISWINRLKLRASYGISGNVAKNAAPYMIAYYTNNYTVGGQYGVISSRPNPNLRWEKTTTTNIALDFDLFKSRLSGTIEYYNKMGTDLLANTAGVPVEGFGYETYQINNGKMRNRGFEFSLNGQIVRSKDFDLHATATYSYNKNKVVYVNSDAPEYYLLLDIPEAYPRIGNPFNAIYGYRWAGLSEDGLPQVFNATGEVVDYDPAEMDAIEYLATTEPTNMWSFNLSMRYKHFDFSCLWVYQGGHYMKNSDLPMLKNGYNSAIRKYVAQLNPMTKDVANRWRQAGDELTTDIPRALFGENPLFSSEYYEIYSYSDKALLNASSLRLANISLAYNLPRVWATKVHLSNARLQFNVENAFTIAKSKQAKYQLGGYTAPNYVLGLYIDL